MNVVPFCFTLYEAPNTPARLSYHFSPEIQQSLINQSADYKEYLKRKLQLKIDDKTWHETPLRTQQYIWATTFHTIPNAMYHACCDADPHIFWLGINSGASIHSIDPGSKCYLIEIALIMGRSSHARMLVCAGGQKMRENAKMICDKLGYPENITRFIMAEELSFMFHY